MKLFDLTGRVAIVTGGNGGIGLGMARGLAQAGAAVVLAGRNTDKSTGAVKELEALGAKAAMVKVDVTSEASCREMVRTLLHGHAYDGSRATRELDLAYTPLDESLRRTVDWYVSEGLAPASSAPR